jgi:signal transduction histidine kinase
MIQRLQHDLKAAIEREKAQEKRKTVFVSTTSNLIGTLINTITFSVNSLKQNNDHMTPEERLQAFSKIEKSLQKARQKVDELLEKEGERL